MNLLMMLIKTVPKTISLIPKAVGKHVKRMRWKHGENPVSEDDVVIVEVMVAELDKAWWRTYRLSLEKTFKQLHVIVRVQAIEIL